MVFATEARADAMPCPEIVQPGTPERGKNGLKPFYHKSIETNVFHRLNYLRHRRLHLYRHPARAAR